MKSRRVFLVCSAGGHFEQAYRLLTALEGFEVTFITERKASAEGLDAAHRVLHLPHASGGRNIFFVFGFLWNCSVSLWRLLRFRPEAVISTGAHTGVPSCVLGKLLGRHVIFIESFARITSPSLSGRIVYPFADLFLVQWESLLRYYPQAAYWGKIY